MSKPHAAQLRLLSFLALAPAAEFVDLVQLEQVWRVRPADELFVPALAAQGWVEMGSGPRCRARITDAGRLVLADPGRCRVEGRT